MDNQETAKTAENAVNETPVVPPSVTPASGHHFDQQDIEKHKAVACLSYIFLLFLVPLLTQKESTFAQFHAKQGMILFITWIVVAFILSVIPFIGWMLLPAMNLLFIVVSVIAIVKTLSGEAWTIPGMATLQKTFNL